METTKENSINWKHILEGNECCRECPLLTECEYDLDSICKVFTGCTIVFWPTLSCKKKQNYRTMNKKAIYRRKELRGRMPSWLYEEANFNDEYHLRKTLFNKSYLRKYRRYLRELKMKYNYGENDGLIGKFLKGIKNHKDPYYYLSHK